MLYDVLNKVYERYVRVYVVKTLIKVPVDTNLQQAYVSWITRVNEEAFKVGFKHPLQNTMKKFISNTSFREVPTLQNQTMLGHFEKNYRNYPNVPSLYYEQKWHYCLCNWHIGWVQLAQAWNAICRHYCGFIFLMGKRDGKSLWWHSDNTPDYTLTFTWLSLKKTTEWNWVHLVMLTRHKNTRN